MAKIEFSFNWAAGNFSLRAQALVTEPITAIVGLSGSGKTSLIHLLSGLTRPDAGVLKFGEDTLVDTTQGIFVPPWKRRFGVVFQESRLWPHQKVLKQIRFGGTYREDEVIELCGVEPYLQRSPVALSGGERQRVALARALMSQPRALLLDEPLVSLDAGSRGHLLDLLRNLRASFDIPMLYVTHAIDEAVGLTDSFLMVHRGEVSGPSSLFEHAQRPGHFEAVNMLGLETILRAKVMSDDAQSGVCRSEAGEWKLTSPRNHAKVGTVIRLGIKPQDVLLGRDFAGNLSAQNKMSGRVIAVRKLADHHIVELDIGQPILAEVTLDSIRDLNIRQGEQVSVIVKSSAFRFRGTCI